MTTETKMAQWEAAIASGNFTDEMLRLYHCEAVACGQIDRARRCYASYLGCNRWDENVCSLLIALCLQQKDYAAAIDAIETLTVRSKPDDALIDAGLSVREHLGPARIDGRQEPTLSLCMIARNEAAYLPSCLKEIKPLVDELVVVDTGSTDRTADIARLFGAHVHSFPWCDDFSAARNFALSHASGDWVLVLDADEAIAQADFRDLRMLIQANKDNSIAFTIQTRNYCGVANAIGWRANEGRYPAHETGMGWFPSNKVRLFKRQKNVLFHFPVHERVEPSLKTAGFQIAYCTVPVHHYGHLNEVRNRKKAQKYYALGYAKLNEMKDDPASIRELAAQAGQLERWAEAIELWQRLLELRPNYLEALINMAAAHWQVGDYPQSLMWSRKAVACDANAREARINLANSLLFLGETVTAVVELKALIDQDPNYTAALFMYAVASVCSGERRQAATACNVIVGHTPAQAVIMAADDLAVRFEDAGMPSQAKAVREDLKQILSKIEADRQ